MSNKHIMKLKKDASWETAQRKDQPFIMRESRKFCQMGCNFDDNGFVFCVLFCFLLFFSCWGERWSKYHHRRAIIGPMAFRWRADDGPNLVLWFFRGSGPVLVRHPIFCYFLGGVRTPCPPLDPPMYMQGSIVCNTPFPHRPRIARIATNWFLLIRGGGDSWGFIIFVSPIVMFYESVPIQIRCRYEYSGESAQFGWNRARIHYD